MGLKNQLPQLTHVCWNICAINLSAPVGDLILFSPINQLGLYNLIIDYQYIKMIIVRQKMIFFHNVLLYFKIWFKAKYFFSLN